MQQARKPAGSTEPTIEVHWPRVGVAHIVLGGEHDLTSAAQLQKTLTETLGWCYRMVADLRNAQFIDSSTIHTLVATKERAEASSRPFNVLLTPSSIIERTLEITQLLGTLNRVNTLDEAMTPVGDLRSISPRQLVPRR